MLSGRLGDVFGYERILLVNFTSFSARSMIAGVAVYSNHVLFILARVLQGIGPAICVPKYVLSLLNPLCAGHRLRDSWALAQ